MKKLNFVFICSILFLGGCRTDDLPPAVKKIDIARYCGKWYEVARLPNWFEDGLSDITADYTPVGNGKIKVVKPRS